MKPRKKGSPRTRAQASELAIFKHKGAKSKSAAKPPVRKEVIKKSADEKLDELLQEHREKQRQHTLQRVQKQRTEALAKSVKTKAKSAAKPPDTKFKRYVSRGVQDPNEGVTHYAGRGLIGVPTPILPYNDISNDHFLNKSHF